MPGYVTAMGSCLVCKTLFSFNPTKVPSMRVRFENGHPVPDKDGSREPLCLDCVIQINKMRRAAGLPEFTIPEDAYDACREEEL